MPHIIIIHNIRSYRFLIFQSIFVLSNSDIFFQNISSEKSYIIQLFRSPNRKMGIITNNVYVIGIMPALRIHKIIQRLHSSRKTPHTVIEELRIQVGPCTICFNNNYIIKLICMPIYVIKHL